MRWGIFLTAVFAIIIVVMLVIYFFLPTNVVEFGGNSENTNFSLSSEKEMQFYPNMRYPSERISYRILDCPLQKSDDMKRAFEILESSSILDFYGVDSNEEITITCDSTAKITEEGNLFIAGEGGPTNITVAGNFNIIQNGKVLLIRDSECPQPNVAIHELLHALGFDHSENPNNIMYEISNCKQTISSDMTNFINEIYSFPALPDILFENVSGIMHSRYLDVVLEVRNNGLKKAEVSKIKIYADDKFVKEVELESLGIGYGRKITLTNIWIMQLNVKEVKFVIENSFEELDKENNEVVLELG